MEPTAPQDDLRDLLEENLELARENNRLIKAMRRDAIIGKVVSIGFWVILAIASFYITAQFLEPYMSALGGGDGQGGGDWQQIIDLYRQQLGQ